jgi:hypothetical protein
MVARTPRRSVRRRRTKGVARFLNWWRTWLSAMIVGTADGVGTTSRRMSERYPVETLFDVRSWPVLGMGLVALFAGVTVAFAIAMPGPTRTAALLTGAATLVWTGGRWLVLRLVAGPLGIDDLRGLRGAFGIGLLPWALALTPELRFAAWALSGVITAVVVWRLGTERRAAMRAVGLAWGAQALGVAGVWLARNAYVIFTGFRN